jgi:AcrR family transcriptional regulator
MAATRISRPERKAQTRADLLVAAREVFKTRGFHRASLDEIAEEAGYTKGAVYSNFADKDALFLAVLEAHYDSRLDAFAQILLEGEDLERTWHEVSRFLADADTREPRWLPLLSEFIAHAARHDDLRQAYVDVRARFLAAIARYIDATQERYGIAYLVPSFEIARASSVLIRGWSAERQLEPDAVSPEHFVELHTAFMRGLTVAAGRSTQ